jgi:hypothetical protein
VSLRTYSIAWDGINVRAALLEGFRYMESLDHIVGVVQATPPMMKSIVLAMPDEVMFDYIPEGFARMRTAYLKYRFLPSDKEMQLVSHDGGVVVKIVPRSPLIPESWNTPSIQVAS